MPRNPPSFVLAVTLFVLAAAAPHEAPIPPGEASFRTTLHLLHDGRFDEAEETVARMRLDRPEDPGAAFFSAFVTYWRLLYDDENPALTRTFEERLARAADISERALGESEHPAGARVWAGYARLLLAQLRVAQKKTLAAAREARLGRRLLDDALRADPSSPEPLFGLGAYNYYADRVSALVKGLRFLLGLPGGDRETGLDQLETCARRSSYFALESRIVLATIYAGRSERLYVNALRQAEQALAVEPDAVVVLDAAARLDLTLGRAGSAAERLDHALARTAQAPRTDPSMTATLRYGRARAEFVQFRPDHTLELLHLIERAGEPIPSRLLRDIAALASAAGGLVGSDPPSAGDPRDGTRSGLRPEVWHRILPALEKERTLGVDASLEELLRLSKALPQESSVSLLVGRALLLSGRAPEALEWLRRAAASSDLPAPWVGPCLLLSGEAADLAGRRDQALELYRKALKAPPFIEVDAGRLYQQVPYRK